MMSRVLMFLFLLGKIFLAAGDGRPPNLLGGAQTPHNTVVSTVTL